MPIVAVEYEGRCYLLEDPHELDETLLAHQLWWIAREHPAGALEWAHTWQQSFLARRTPIGASYNHGTEELRKVLKGVAPP